MVARLAEEAEIRSERKLAEAPDSIELELRRLVRPDDALEQISQHRFQKDYDRVLYSTAFRRLGGTTQVVTPGESSVIHNRLTHSLKVAQTSRLVYATLLRRALDEPDVRRVLKQYGGLSVDVLQTSCLAHDLGHPPFGHVGEVALQELLADPRKYIPGYNAAPDSALCFEGNAQSFRIVTKLAFRESSNVVADPALNLTRASLAAQSKYPWNSEHSYATEKRKWGAYSTEATLLDWALEGFEGRKSIVRGVEIDERRSIEAQVMDWSDDVAYAVHDAEDFFRAGLVPLHALFEQGAEYDRFYEYALDKTRSKLPGSVTDGRIQKILERALLEFPRDPYIGSRADRLAIRRFASHMIDEATNKLNVNAEGVLVPEDDIFILIEILKQLTWYYVIDRPSLSSAQRGQQAIVAGLVSILWAWAHKVYGQIVAPVSSTGSPPDTQALESARRVVQDSKSLLTRRYRELPTRLVDYIDIAIGEATELSGDALQRAILRGTVDYTCSLTDSEASSLHARLNGATGQSMLFVGVSL